MASHAWHSIRAETPDLAIAIGDRNWALQQRQRSIAQREQHLINTEVRETRRTLLRTVRRRGGTDGVAFCDDDFLTVADRPALYRAILDAAVTVGRADNADLQLYNPHENLLRLVAHHGFPARFLTFFATVNATTPTACAAALTTRRPVLIDDVTRHEIFTGYPTQEAMLDAGSRAVSSYPLIDGDRILGVLSFHHGKPACLAANAELVASCATRALTRMS